MEEDRAPSEPTPTESSIEAKQPKEKWTIANYLTAGQLLLSVIVAVVTFNLFRIANKQYETASRVAEATIRVAHITDTTFKINVESGKRRFKMDSANAQAQINALEKQLALLKEQFEIENTPFLSITALNIINFKRDNILFNYEIRNGGKPTVKVIGIKAGIRFDTILKKNSASLNRSIKIQKVNFYIASGMQSIGICQLSGKDLWDTKIDFNKSQQPFKIYWHGEIEYVNTTNNKRRKFTYIIRIHTPINQEDKLNSTEQIENDNLSID